MSCSGFYFMLHRYADHIKLEREFKRKLRSLMKKYGWV